MDNEEIEIREAAHLWGLTTIKAEERLRNEFRALKKLEMSEPLRVSLGIFLPQLEELWAHQVRSELRSRSSARRSATTRPILSRAQPPLGPAYFTAIRFVLELGEDLSQFGSGKKIESFVGLTPSEDSTGETERKGHITGMGPGFIRATLIESSWVAARKDPVLLAKFTRVWHASGNKKKAIVAVARMLSVRLRTCVISGTPCMIGIAV